MSEDKKPFTVSDRRHFDSEGRSRTDLAAEREAGSEEPKRTSATDAPSPSASSPSSSPADATDHGASPRPAQLAELFITLQAQGNLLLAGAEEGGPPDLDGARWVVSVLEMLKEKTAGRRTPEEDRVLDAVLYQLRMAYVERTRAGGS
jgi:hypothetical protein